MLMMALGLISCSKEQLPQVGYNVIISAGIENNKTYLDDLKVLWSENDQIVVNGQKSTGISIGDPASHADFTLPAGVQAPYYALYPASAYLESGTYGSLTLPESQTYVLDSFDPAAGLMCAYSPVSKDGLSFRTGVTYLKLSVSGTEYKDNIKRVEVYAIGNEDMSGVMEFNPDSRTLVNTGMDGKGVTLCGDIAQGKNIYIAIASKTYSKGIKLRIVDVHNHYMEITSKKTFEALPSSVYPTAITFNPTGTLVDAGTDPFREDKTLKVLFIGNSHDLDATAYLPLMLNKQGVRDFEFTRVFHGGYWLQGYYSNYDLPKNCSITTWKPGQHNWRGEYTLDYSLKDAVEAEQYDIVVIQEYAGHPTCWTWNQAERDAINGLLGKIRVSSPKADIYYFMSHCFSKDYSVVVEQFDNDTDKQFAASVEGNGKHILDPSEGFPFKGFISTGALVQSLRTTGLNVYNDLLRGDSIHLDYGMTRVAGALLMWKHIITPRTGISPEAVRFRLFEYYPYSTMHTTPFLDSNREAVLAAVNAAYEKPLEVTDLSSYSAVPSYVNEPGVSFLDLDGVDVEPCRFPVLFRLGYRSGAQTNNSNVQGGWTQFGTIQSFEQPQAFLKWVSVSNPVSGLIYTRTYSNSSASNISSFALDEVWTGDYMEFVIPVKNIKAGTKIRFEAPFYTRQGPVFWYLDYLDGGEWKCNHSTLTSWDGSISRDATFAIGYGQTAISSDVVLSNAVSSGFLRFRIRCADGRVQADSSGAIERDTPYMNGNAYGSVFYFWGTSQNLSFSIVES